MTHFPAITVILPVYNNQTTIKAALDSILQQSFTDFEVLVVNDGSTDGTNDFLKTVQDERVRVIGSADNKGLPQRLNEAIAESRGDYIARMDADDIAYPDRLEKQFQFLQSNPSVDLVAGRALVFDDAGHIYGMLPFAADHSVIAARPWNSFPMPHPTWTGRKAWFEHHRYAIPEIWRAEDQDLLLRAHKESRYACLPDVVLLYRRMNPVLKKVALARRSTLLSQYRYFCAQEEWMNFLKSVLVFCAKSLFDILQSVPIVRTYYAKKRLAIDISDAEMARAQAVLERYQNV